MTPPQQHVRSQQSVSATASRGGRIAQRLIASLTAIAILLTQAAFAGASPTVEQALDAMDRRDYKTALALWETLATAGDSKAAVTLGLMHHQGEGTPVNYAAAMDWYLKAYERNGDARNNIGVMHRDGLDVPVNRKIAYLLFLSIHMSGFGDEETIMRANRNLRDEIATLSDAERQEALCYTLEYVDAYVKSKGVLSGIPKSLRASNTRKRIRDLDWWMPGEVGEFECPEST